MAEKKEAKRGIQVAFPDILKGGVYSNIMHVTHTREEFVLDFLVVLPPAGAVTARVITSPGHIKRMIAALQQNLQKYEASFGSVAEAPEPPRPLGFQPPPK